MDSAMNSPTMDVDSDSKDMDIFSPFPVMNAVGLPSPTGSTSTPKTDAHSEPYDASTPLPEPSNVVERCNTLMERIQWLFQLDQCTYDAYGYEYAGLGLLPVLIRPRVDHTAAKALLLDILKTVDPYITNWVFDGERAAVGPHLAVLKLFRAAFEAYPAVRCWNTVHDALCRFLRVLLSTDDVTVDRIDTEICIYEMEMERSGTDAIIDGQILKKLLPDMGEYSALDGMLFGRLSPIPMFKLDLTLNWDHYGALEAMTTDEGDEDNQLLPPLEL